MENFFASLKTERPREVYRTREDAKADVFDYIERFYNPVAAALAGLSQPHGIRRAGQASLTACPPNQQQLKNIRPTIGKATCRPSRRQ